MAVEEKSVAAPAASNVPDSVRASYEQVNRLWRALNGVYNRGGELTGLSDSALDVIWALLEAGEGCLQRDVCAYTYLGKQTVNSAVHRLAEQGMLRLEPAAKGRGMRLFFTDEGRAFAQERVQPLLTAEFEAFASLSEEDRAAMLRAERAFTEALSARYDDLERALKGDAGPH